MRRIVVLAVVVVAAGALTGCPQNNQVALPPPGSFVPHGSQSFAFTGASQTFTVPNFVTQVTVTAVGAAGNASGGLPRAFGEVVVATVSVSPGEMLDVVVGGAEVDASGAGGFNGGAGGYRGGGGASDIRLGGTALANRIIVAGGGGGNGCCEVRGGNAGYLTGTAGSNASSGGAGGGGGGTQATGGSAGSAGTSGTAGTAGSLGLGGAGVSSFSGGGGGGYYGGGGGGVNSTVLGGGGGGGSSFVGSPAVHVSDAQATAGQCDASNDGCITFTW